MFDVFSISTTSSWPSLYTTEFMAYFFNLLHLGKCSYRLRLYVHVALLNYSVHIPPLNDLHQQYFEGLFCTHTSPSLTHSLQIPSLHHLVCTLGNFMAYLVFFLLGELQFTCDILWQNVPLVTYSVHVHPLGDLFRKYGTFRSFTLYTYLPMLGGVFYNYHLFMTYFVHMGFFGFFVYLLLGEVVFIWVIYYGLHVNVLVVTYSVHMH